MIDSAIFLGEPIYFKKICKIYPPTVKDVVANIETQRYIMTICWNQDDIDDILEKNSVSTTTKPTPFEFIMLNCYKNQTFTNIVKNALTFFTHEKDIHILPEQMCIYFGTMEDIPNAKVAEDLRCLNQDNFLDFQNAVRTTLGFEIEEPEPENLNPIVKRVREAARKRKRIIRKNKKNKGVDYSTSMAAICCMGMGLNPSNIGNIPYATMHVLIQTYQKKERYEIDLQSICAGADPKKVKPKYWIRPDDNDVPTVPIEGLKK